MGTTDLQTIGLYLQTLAIMASMAFIIAGWKVLYRNAKRIASRNETYALLLKTQSEILHAEKQGLEFWSNASQQTNLDSYILALNVERIRKLLNLLSMRGINVDDRYIYLLRNAITLDAEASSDVAQEKIQQKLVHILRFSCQIQNDLHNAYTDRYQA
jgi:hypothetical protein